MADIPGYYFCRLLEDDEVDTQDRGGAVNEQVTFRFLREIEPDVFTIDSYWPSNRSCRPYCCNHCLTPPTTMPSAARIAFLGLTGTEPIPEPVQDISFPADLHQSHRDTTSADFVSVSEPPNTINVELRAELGIVEQLGAPIDWKPQAFGLLGRIVLSDGAGASYQLLYLTDALLNMSVPVALSAIEPLICQILASSLKPFSFNNREILLLGHLPCRDETDEVLAVYHDDGERIEWRRGYAWSPSNEIQPPTGVLNGWYRKESNSVQSFTSSAGFSGIAAQTQFARRFCWPVWEMDVGQRWNMQFKIRGPAGRNFRNDLGLSINGSFGGFSVELPFGGSGGINRLNFVSVSHIGGTPTWEFMDPLDSFFFVPEISFDFDVDMLLDVNWDIDFFGFVPGVSLVAAGNIEITFGDRTITRRAAIAPDIDHQIVFEWRPSWRFELIPIWFALFDHSELYAYESNGWYDDQKPASVEWLNFGQVT